MHRVHCVSATGYLFKFEKELVHLMDPSSLPVGLGGTVASIEPYLRKLYLIIRKRSKKKEAQERLIGALRALEDLKSAIEDIKKCGSEFLEAIDVKGAPIGAMAADRLYGIGARSLIATANILAATRKLALQADRISRYESFMADLKVLNKPQYEFVMMLSRSIKLGKLDPSEFPTYISLYGSRELHEGMRDAEKALAPIEDRMLEIIEAIPPPFRHREKAIRHAVNQLGKERENIVSMDDKVTQELLDASPDWMRALSDMAERSAKKGREVAERRARRSLSPKKGPPPTTVWPQRQRKKH
jgi:hypothetical protein